MILVLGFSISREQDKARADQSLREALERKMNDSMSHFAMGMLRRVQNRLNESRIELESAIALDPNNARALQQLGLTLCGWANQTRRSRRSRRPFGSTHMTQHSQLFSRPGKRTNRIEGLTKLPGVSKRAPR
jgi:Tfp pilus assembly protein PilF